MKQLRNILQNELAHSEALEPKAGHQDRFAKKLDQQLYKQQWRKALWAISAAVVISVLMMLAYFQLYNIDYMPQTTMILAQTQAEYVDAEYYYQTRIEKSLKELSLNTNKQFYNNLVVELKDIDKDFIGLKKDLKRNPGDERIINAVINCYILKVETIETLLKKVKEEKYENHL